MKSILDACCGSKMFWFDKNNPNAIYVDIRKGNYESGTGKNFRTRRVSPDIIADFRKLPFENNRFSMVVFDPPHLKCKPTAYMAASYGYLDNDWKNLISAGFSECFRVLKPYGTLVFKWNESQIPLKDVLMLTDQAPVVGNQNPKGSGTHWIIFMKTHPHIEKE